MERVGGSDGGYGVAARTVHGIHFLRCRRGRDPAGGWENSGGLVLFRRGNGGFGVVVGSVDRVMPGGEGSGTRRLHRCLEDVVVQVRERIAAGFIFSVEQREENEEVRTDSGVAWMAMGKIGKKWKRKKFR